MPVSRSARRRRSSLGIAASLNPIKPGNYGIHTSPRSVTFAPNVTPGTFVEDTDGDGDYAADVPSPSDALFPPAETPAPPPTRRRAPPGKRRSQGYIPRPPNAFMLFRANFVRQKHVPGSIETNHGSLSKIIGNCWKALPDQEKKVWEAKAKKAKAEHKEMYPHYRFKPVHNKDKKKLRKDKIPLDEPDERRCEEVAQLLLEGKKGDELAAAVRRLDLDRRRDGTGSASPMPPLYAPLPMPAPMYSHLAHRRSSSVPPNLSFRAPIAIPQVSLFAPGPSTSRADSPVGNIARTYRGGDLRRPSSAGPTCYDAWVMPGMPMPFSLNDLQRDPEPLPEINTEFNTEWFQAPFRDENETFGNFGAPQGSALFGDNTSNPALALSISPLDNVPPPHLADSLSSASTAGSSAYPYSAITPADHSLNPTPWMPTHEEFTPSASPSGFSATPPPDFEPHGDMALNMYAADPAGLQWAGQGVAIVHGDAGVAPHDGLAFQQPGEFVDPAVNMHEFMYDVDQYGAPHAACGIEPERYAYNPEEVHYQPVEISQGY